MSLDTQHRVHGLLRRMSTEGLAAAKQLFWTELNYDHANQPLSDRQWPESAKDVLHEPPVLLAQHESEFGSFDIIHAKLGAEQRGHTFPLSISAERQVVNQLLKDHPYAVFLFSNPAETHWHLVNVRYDPEVANRRVFRRIAVGPNERLRTASERVAMLDVASLAPDLFGVSPLAIQQRHDEAFDVEAVTKAFFTTYRQVFERVEGELIGPSDEESRRLFTQRLFNRLLFLVFLERKGWLSFEGEHEYLRALWDAHRAEAARGEPVNFYRDRLYHLFFSGLNAPNEVNVIGINRGGFMAKRIGEVPYLNGGLFEKEELDQEERVTVPDEVWGPALDDLLYHYNFTVTESTPLDIEVAVDPEMLGKIFEELVTGRHESGSYYTPKPIVAFMGQEALKGYLETACPEEREVTIAAFVEERDASSIRDPEVVLTALRTVKVCDPACGSGAYLVGMLHELLDLRAALFATRQADAPTVYERKLEIIQHNLYGVDIDPFAVNIARLRLWLSLIVDFEGEVPPPLPNLDFKIEVGDSLVGPDPSGGLQPGLFRQQQIDTFFRLRGEYLQAHGGEKRTLLMQIDELRAGIADWAHPEGVSTEGFDWAVEYAEVFCPQLAESTLLGATTEVVNQVPDHLELIEHDSAGFHIVLANPPYVRADAQFKHVINEQERQAAIAQWSLYRKQLKRRRTYETLYEKWDLYIPFLERAWQLLTHNGRMVLIISDAYNTVKYALKSHQFFLANSAVVRLDFCSDIPLFQAGILNTIVHFAKAQPPDDWQPLRFRRWGHAPDDFERNVEQLWTQPQATWGTSLFRPDTESALQITAPVVPLEQICYISVGMVIHADEDGHQGEFQTDDLLADLPSEVHQKRFVLGKDTTKWKLADTRYLEWGTARAPAHFRRATFPEMHEAREKLLAVRTPGASPTVAYDDAHTYFDASSVAFVPWHSLVGVTNRSINRTTKYRWESPDGDREHREALSREFDLKYLLAVMNSSLAQYWLSRRRRSKVHIYPGDWKGLPIARAPMQEQRRISQLVNRLLDSLVAKGVPHGTDSSAVSQLERELDALVYEVYGLTEEAIASIEAARR